MSENIGTASAYTKVGAAYTAIFGVLTTISAVFWRIPYPIGSLMMIGGLVVLFLGITSYITTTMKLNAGDIRGAKGPCLIWGIAFLFVGLVGGIFFLLAHSTISQYLAQPRVVERPPPITRREGEEATIVAERAIGSLECIAGPDKGRKFSLWAGNLKIGRGERNDISLSDRTVSRRHAEISWDGISFRITDLGSRNGTMVNRNSLTPGQYMILQDGDEITLGANTVLRFSTIGVGAETETMPPGQPREEG